MSDDWIKDAEQQRALHHPHEQIQGSGQKALRDKFYAANERRIKDVLAQVGQLWKSLDPNRPGILFIGRHPGNDYYVNALSGIHTISLYLFDKSNLRIWSQFVWGAVPKPYPTASISIEVMADSFNVIVPGATVRNDLRTVEDVKTLISGLWADNKIPLAK